MAWYNSLVHAGGNVIGPALKGTGTAYDYLTPGNGTSKMTNVGNAITNPNVTLSDPAALGFGQNSGFTYAAPQPTAQPTANQDTGALNQPTTDTTVYDPNATAQASAIGIVNSQLNRLPTQLSIAQGNIGDQYNVGRNQLDSNFAQGQSQYNTQSTQNQQNLRTNKNTITDMASQGLRGLLRLLGSFGANGSDRSLASQAVAQDASMQRAGAGQTFAGNQRNLDTNWAGFQNQDQQDRRQLEDWRTQQLNSAEQQSMTNRQSLLQQLAGLMSDPSQASTYLTQADALNPAIDALGRFSPTYTGATPVYAAPTLDSYQTVMGNPSYTIAPAENAANPYTTLTPEERRRQQQLATLA